MRTVVFWCLLMLSATSRSAECDPWTARIDFKMEGASYQDTIAWVGGWVAAIASINGEAKELHVCIPICEYYVSRKIVDILNAKFRGQTISAEAAAAAIWPGLKEQLVCPEAK